MVRVESPTLTASPGLGHAPWCDKRALPGGTPAPGPLVRLLSAHWPASMRMRTSPGARLDLHYGQRLRNRIDYFPARRPGPVLVLMASAYDQPCGKADLAFVAAGLLAHGMHVAIVDASEAPSQTLAGMQAEYRAAVRWLHARAGAFGGDTRRLLLCGWGAGAPAAALCLDEPGVIGALVIGGVYDLARLRGDPGAGGWRVDDHDVLSLSPRRLRPSPLPMVIACGEHDPDSLRQEARRFAAWRAGAPGLEVCVPGEDRHALLVGLADPEGPLAAHVRALVVTGTTASRLREAAP